MFNIIFLPTAVVKQGVKIHGTLVYIKNVVPTFHDSPGTECAERSQAISCGAHQPHIIREQ